MGQVFTDELLALGFRLLAPGCRLSSPGYRLSAVGFRLSVPDSRFPIPHSPAPTAYNSTFSDDINTQSRHKENNYGTIKVTKNVGGIEGLCIIEPAVHGDERGYFMETYNRKDMEEAGFHIDFVQDNQSMSTKGVLRGLHFQKHYP